MSRLIPASVHLHHPDAKSLDTIGRILEALADDPTEALIWWRPMTEAHPDDRHRTVLSGYMVATDKGFFTYDLSGTPMSASAGYSVDLTT